MNIQDQLRLLSEGTIITESVTDVDFKNEVINILSKLKRFVKSNEFYQYIENDSKVKNIQGNKFKMVFVEFKNALDKLNTTDNNKYIIQIHNIENSIKHALISAGMQITDYKENAYISFTSKTNKHLSGDIDMSEIYQIHIDYK